jgi:hypothetical protein
MEELFFSTCFFIRHTSLEDTVSIWEREDDFARRLDEGLFSCIEESDLVGVMSDPSLAERVIHNKSTYKSKC